VTTTVLVTGFEPFGADRENAGERAVALRGAARPD
jgi:pyrrolidone-carboxylate peptidase